MAATHVYAGAAATMEGTRGGIYRQGAGDAGWQHLTSGLPDGAEVHAITVHPENPDTVYIGTTKGTFRSTNRGDRWERLSLPDPAADIWSICIHPKNPRVIYAGATPPAVYRSNDGGDTWRPMNRGLTSRYIPDPTAEVRYGHQSWEEMMIGFFDVAVDPAMDKNAFFVR